MIDQYLEAGRLDAEADVHASGQDELLNIADLLADLEHDWHVAARERGLAFTWAVDIKDADATVAVDAASLRRILDNLIGNAIKFTAKGSVSVQAARAPDAPGRVRLSVADTGAGIAAEHLPRLFDDFYQVNNPNRRIELGAGLGLAIARRYAQRLGTSISVESELGRGSCFSIDLPARFAGTG